jgi:hypothetical protein
MTSKVVEMTSETFLALFTSTFTRFKKSSSMIVPTAFPFFAAAKQLISFRFMISAAFLT